MKTIWIETHTEDDYRLVATYEDIDPPSLQLQIEQGGNDAYIDLSIEEVLKLKKALNRFLVNIQHHEFHK